LFSNRARTENQNFLQLVTASNLHEQKKMKNNNFLLNDWCCKENNFFFAEISVSSYCKLKKTIRIIIKSLV